MTTSVQVVRRNLLLVVGSCVLGVLALYVFAVRTEVGQRVDEAAVFTNRYVRTTDQDADRYLFIVQSVIGAALLLVLWWGRTQLRLVLVAVGGVVTSYVAAAGLREFVFDRVDLVGHDSMNGPSFPSGHTAAAVAVSLALVLVGPKDRWTSILAAGLAGSVATAVVLIPIHRPSDALGGELLALAITCLALCVVPGALSDLARRASGTAPPTGPAVVGVPILVAVWVALSLAWLLFTDLLARRAGFRLDAFGSTYPAAVAVVTAGAVAVVGVFGAVARPRSPDPGEEPGGVSAVGLGGVA